jgi:heme/copper-type cytochrome/quinol oxidase subunit 2
MMAIINTLFQILALALVFEGDRVDNYVNYIGVLILGVMKVAAYCHFTAKKEDKKAVYVMYIVWVVALILTIIIMGVVIWLITNEIYSSPNWATDARFCNVTITGFKRSFGNSNSFVIRANDDDPMQ